MWWKEIKIRLKKKWHKISIALFIALGFKKLSKYIYLKRKPKKIILKANEVMIETRDFFSKIHTLWEFFVIYPNYKDYIKFTLRESTEYCYTDLYPYQPHGYMCKNKNIWCSFCNILIGIAEITSSWRDSFKILLHIQ